MARQSTTTTKAKANPKGRPTKLSKEKLETARQYISDNDTMNPTALLPTVERLSIILDVHRDTLYEWADKNAEFSDILRHLMAVQGDKLLQNSLIGRYNPVITKLMLSKHGYVDKQEVDQNVTGDVSFVNAVPRPKAGDESADTRT